MTGNKKCKTCGAKTVHRLCHSCFMQELARRQAWPTAREKKFHDDHDQRHDIRKEDYN